MGDLRDGETPGFCDGSAESVEVEGGFDLFPMQQEQGAEEFGKALRISILSLKPALPRAGRQSFCRIPGEAWRRGVLDLTGCAGQFAESQSEARIANLGRRMSSINRHSFVSRRCIRHIEKEAKRNQFQPIANLR